MKVNEPSECLKPSPTILTSAVHVMSFTHHSCDTLSVSGVILQWRNRTSRPCCEEKELPITLSICFNMLQEPHGWDLPHGTSSFEVYSLNVNFNVIIVELVIDIFISHNQNYPNWGIVKKKKKNLYHTVRRIPN